MIVTAKHNHSDIKYKNLNWLEVIIFLALTRALPPAILSASDKLFFKSISENEWNKVAG